MLGTCIGVFIPLYFLYNISENVKPLTRQYIEDYSEEIFTFPSVVPSVFDVPDDFR